MIKISDLLVQYSTRLILKNISLEVKKGEILALLGPNGSGKSTLLRAISGTIPLLGGEILINGHSVHSLRSAQRARLISVVPQSAFLPPAFTAWQTVLMGRTPYINFLGQISPGDEQIAHSALEKVDALALAERPVGELSGGEKQRILLARALAQSTPVLLLDEPTASLDLQHQMGLLELIRKLCSEESLTIIIALHDLNLAARYADRVALLLDGKIRAAGSVREVLSAEVIAEAYSWPVHVIEHPFLDSPLILPASRH